MSIKIVIGSWGSYNACNERSRGSEWLDLSKFQKSAFFAVAI